MLRSLLCFSSMFITQQAPSTPSDQTSAPASPPTSVAQSAEPPVKATAHPIEETAAIVHRIQAETKRRFEEARFVRVEEKIEQRVEVPPGYNHKPPPNEDYICTSWMGPDKLRTEVHSTSGSLLFAVSCLHNKTREFAPKWEPRPGMPPKQNVLLEYDGRKARIDNCTLISGCVFGDLTVSWMLPDNSLADTVFRTAIADAELLGVEDHNRRQCMHFRKSFKLPGKSKAELVESSDDLFVEAFKFDLVAWVSTDIQADGVKMIRSREYTSITFHESDIGWPWRVVAPNEALTKPTNGTVP